MSFAWRWTRIVRTRNGPRGAVLCALAAALSGPAAASDSFVAFESGQVRPLALSADGQRLFAVNTPDNRLEIFDVRSDLLRHAGSVPVGLEPVAVAVHRRGEVWVVNHLSDSVSVVDVSGRQPRVVRTLLVGDEPNDIVFAGPGRHRAFVTTAHRGQNSPFPRSEYGRPGVGRADVWVFDARKLGSSLGGDALAVLTLFGDKPRALAATPDGRRVYAAVFKSGNRTALAPRWVVCQGEEPCQIRDTDYPGGIPPPNANVEGVPAPQGSLIVRYDVASGEWLDELGRDWSAAIRFELPDLDVFEIDAWASPPRQRTAWSDVGTVLFDLEVNPATGAVYVANTEAINEVRFEGAGRLASSLKPAGEPPSVRGRLHQARITTLREGDSRVRHLNDHIDYDVVPSPAGTKELSLATPVGMAVSRDGRTLYVAALGSGKIGVIDTRALEDGSSIAATTVRIPVPGGPSGLVLDEDAGRLYVLTRFDDSVVAIDTRSGTEVQRVRLFNPEPTSLVRGRPFLYDARLTSSNGEASCAACHVFGDVDDLAWDLGDPDGRITPNPNPPVAGAGAVPPFHPMKGPMTTQSLRGLRNHGPMHWRGDRTGGNATPPGDPLDERLAFEAFSVAFERLLGRDGELEPEQMGAFADFALQLTYPPNPIARLDGRLREDERSGRAVFFESSSFAGDPERHCDGCHRLDPRAGLFGSAGETSTRFKVPHLRNLYQKIGMFGLPAPALFLGGEILGRADFGPTGPQVRAFGFVHDGAFDTVARFVSQLTFLLDEEEVRNLEAFLLAFESDLAPVVGQQVTLDRQSGAAIQRRVDLLIERSAAARLFRGEAATECDLVVKGVVDGEPRGWVRTPTGTFRSDRADESAWSEASLRALALEPGQELTWTCVPPGSGIRIGIDRDANGVLDADEDRRRRGRDSRGTGRAAPPI